MLTVKNQIFHVLSDSAAETQIMVLEKQTSAEVPKTGVFNQLDMYRFKVTQGAGNRISIM